ncbi:prolyl hydroxylase family protein [Qipengyuania sp. DSG2-2]|uniref:prolyl hydroxylase family protein n=1 Tax=Qipengyuania sp. DGS2-2 TaxID=3349631 RepID=UPI0036D2372E
MTQTTTDIPDQAALARLGKQVRNRLDIDPKAYKVPTDLAEIYAIGDFLTLSECQRLRDMIDAVAQPSQLHEGAYVEGFRTSYSGNFKDEDPFVRGISRRVDDLLGLPGELGERMQGQRYLVGQQFKPHHDFFYPSEDYWKAERKRGGQRSWTAMMFLNEVESGGATNFTNVGIDIEPKPGVLLVWNNHSPDGSPNQDTLHAGTPVSEGEKYVITRWYRVRKWG